MGKVTVLDNGCWAWAGKHNNWGRPIFFLGVKEVGKRTEVLAYRWAYEQLVGPIPEGLVLDHYACHRGGDGCANPYHCRPELNEINAGNTKRSRQTHCKRGHELTPENLYAHPKGRMCRACSIEASRRRRARMKGKPT